jgi:LAO/AO transport system kinase
MGDDIQAIKAGILEIADIFVVSKADKPGADQAVAELAMLLSLDPDRRKALWRIPILKTSALKEQGIAQLVDAIQQHRQALSENGQLEQRTQRQARSELQMLILQTTINALKAEVSDEEWDRLVLDITRRERDPYTVAHDLANRIGLKQS